MCNCNDNPGRNFLASMPFAGDCGCGCGGHARSDMASDNVTNCEPGEHPYVEWGKAQVATAAQACQDPCELAEELARLRAELAGRPVVANPQTPASCGDDSGTLPAPAGWADNTVNEIGWTQLPDGNCPLPVAPVMVYSSSLNGPEQQVYRVAPEVPLSVLTSRIKNPTLQLQTVEVLLSQPISALRPVRYWPFNIATGMAYQQVWDPEANYGYSPAEGWIGVQIPMTAGAGSGLGASYPGIPELGLYIQAGGQSIRVAVSRDTGTVRLLDQAVAVTASTIGTVKTATGAQGLDFTFRISNKTEAPAWQLSLDNGVSWSDQGKAGALKLSTRTGVLAGQTRFLLKATLFDGVIVNDFAVNPITGQITRSTVCQQGAYPVGCGHNQFQLNVPAGVAITAVHLAGSGDAGYQVVDCKTISVTGTSGVLVGAVVLRRKNSSGVMETRTVNLTSLVVGNCQVTIGSTPGSSLAVLDSFVTSPSVTGAPTRVLSLELDNVVAISPPVWSDYRGNLAEDTLTLIVDHDQPVTVEIQTTQGPLIATSTPARSPYPDSVVIPDPTGPTGGSSSSSVPPVTTTSSSSVPPVTTTSSSVPPVTTTSSSVPPVTTSSSSSSSSPPVSTSSAPPPATTSSSSSSPPALAISQPVLNCQTGVITLAYTGGDSTPVSWLIPGIGSGSGNQYTIPSQILNSATSDPLDIQLTQGGRPAVHYSFNFRAYCAATSSSSAPPASSSSSTPPATSTSSTVVPIGAANIDMVFDSKNDGANGGTYDYIFTVKLIEPGMNETNQVAQIGSADTRYIGQKSLTQAIVVAALGQSNGQTTIRFYRFAFSIARLRELYPAKTSVRFNVYGTRAANNPSKLYTNYVSITVNRSRTSGIIPLVPTSNNIDFTTTNATPVPAPTTYTNGGPGWEVLTTASVIRSVTVDLVQGGITIGNPLAETADDTVVADGPVQLGLANKDFQGNDFTTNKAPDITA